MEIGVAVVGAAAAAALDTSRTWPVLLAMRDEGGWAQAIWEFADAVNGRGGIVTGGGSMPPTPELARGICQPS